MNTLIHCRAHVGWGCTEGLPHVVGGLVVSESVIALGVGRSTGVPGDQGTVWDRLALRSSAELTSQRRAHRNYLMHDSCFILPRQRRPTEHLGDRKGLGKKQMVGRFSPSSEERPGSMQMSCKAICKLSPIVFESLAP